MGKDQMKKNGASFFSFSRRPLPIAYCLSLLKKYPVDAGLIVLFLLCAFLFAERPEVDYLISTSPPYSKGLVGFDRKVVTAVKGEPGRSVKTVPSSKRVYKYVAERNIFDPGGNYEKPKELKIIPENPYNLIAVLQGKENRAIFMEYTGSAMSFKVGDKMIDGAVVKSIDRLSVTVKKGKKLKEYRIFEIKKKQAIGDRQ
jgi:hypothetical protein